jgi:hypothetical protein
LLAETTETALANPPSIAKSGTFFKSELMIRDLRRGFEATGFITSGCVVPSKRGSTKASVELFFRHKLRQRTTIID